MWLSVPTMILVGGLMALQTRVNGELSVNIGEGLRAGLLSAVVSFGSGLVVLTVFMFSSAKRRTDLRKLRSGLAERSLPRWQFFGGALGALLVASQGITAATLGVVLFAVAVIAGQTSAAIAVDRIGLGPAGKQAISLLRVLAATITVGAVVLTAYDKLHDGASKVAGVAVLLALLPLLAGAGTSVQQAINARVSQLASPWAATWGNFLVGTATLVALLVVSFVVPGHVDGLPSDWRLYTGGLLGIVFIATAAFLVRRYGVLVFSLCTIAGQISGAALLDYFNPSVTVGSLTVLGGCLTLVGVWLGLLGSRKKAYTQN